MTEVPHDERMTKHECRIGADRSAASSPSASSCWSLSGACCVNVSAEDLPAAWRSSWQSPPATDRPLQIVHGIPAARASVEGMQYYRDRGLGGIVCNVAFDQYLQSEANWKTLEQGIAACRQLGLVVWLYDEEGYPSGAAGGLVLAKDRAVRSGRNGLRRRPRRSVCAPPSVRVHARHQQLPRGSPLCQSDRRSGRPLFRGIDARGVPAAAGTVFRRHHPGHCSPTSLR